MSKFLDQTGLARVRDWIKTNFATKTSFGGASANQNGSSGLVPAPSAGDEDKVLGADGTWKTVSGGGTVSVFTGATATDDGTEGLVPAPLQNSQNKMLTGNGSWRYATQQTQLYKNGDYQYIKYYRVNPNSGTARTYSIECEILWINSSPTSSFASQTIQLRYPVTNYLFWVVECIGLTSNTEKLSYIMFGANGTRMTCTALSTNTNKGIARTFDIDSSGAQLTFNDAYYNNDKANTRMVPYRVLGFFELGYSH